MEMVEYTAILNGVKASIESLVAFGEQAGGVSYVADGSVKVIKDVRQTLFTLAKSISADYLGSEDIPQ
jgi:hypothetical protein